MTLALSRAIALVAALGAALLLAACSDGRPAVADALPQASTGWTQFVPRPTEIGRRSYDLRVGSCAERGRKRSCPVADTLVARGPVGAPTHEGPPNRSEGTPDG